MFQRWPHPRHRNHRRRLFVAMMLGASRPTVTVVAGTLQNAGLITYRHGRVSIVDRQKLEAASCECYRAATHLLKGCDRGEDTLNDDRPQVNSEAEKIARDR